MKHIVLFGAGKSATVLIDYLNGLAAKNVCKVTIADNDINAVYSKLGNAPAAYTAQVNIENETQRKNLIQQADIVISLMPPTLHYILALDCIEFGKHLLTASYTSEELKKLQPKIEAKGLLFLSEMGLDPGIDHMSAMQMIHSIHAKGGIITSFKSHCGGLVAPENDDNPWHYKISWNPRNVVLAGKAGAVYKLDGKVVHLTYEQLFNPENLVHVSGVDTLAYYANRDSLSYATLYNLQHVQTFLRTTLRYPDFCLGWKNIIALQLTDEVKMIDTNGMSIAIFFKNHFNSSHVKEWLNNLLRGPHRFFKEMKEKMGEFMDAAAQALIDGTHFSDEYMVVDKKGELSIIDTFELENEIELATAITLNEYITIMNQLIFLGFDDDKTLINKGICSAADVLQFLLETKLALKPNEKDMVVMMHEINYNLDGISKKINSSFKLEGEDHLRTAMAKTVGLPLGIAAKLLVEDKLQVTGLQIPILPAIYEPVLRELINFGIEFMETEVDE